MLVGLPEMSERLQLRKNRSLWSRVHTRLCLGEALPADTAEYVHVRLRRAGCERDVFGSDALALLHEATHGRLRDIDRLATACLKLAARRRLRTADRDVLARALDGELPADDVD